MKIDLKTFNQLVKEKYISCQKHEKADLLIWNYTQKCQFEHKWTEETMMARGLITDLEGNIKARPFKKFFNYEEHVGEDSKLPKLPLEDFEVFDKLDGSLGILYWIGYEPYIATRGSFTSDQAIHATKILREKYPSIEKAENRTYLFEIIYPENRIVVDYGETDDLFLLAVINNETGLDEPYEAMKMVLGRKLKIVERFDGLDDLSKIKVILKRDNSEGFVIKFKTSVRTKLKYEEYVRLHRLITGVNAKSIWDLLRHDESLDELMEKVPDEFFDWVTETKKSLEDKYKDIFGAAFQVFTDIHEMKERKDQALAIKDFKYRSIVFALLSGKEYSRIIWQMIKPRADKPYKEDIDA